MEGSVLLQRVSSKLAEKKPLSNEKIKARATSYVVFTCLVSAMSGALFGYDGGISGGVSVMPGFAGKFFPGQLAQNSAGRSYYCKRNDPVLQLFASIMYFTGAVASIPGALLSKRFGRTMTMTLAGTSFVIGAAILASAPRTAMLLVGRVFWGIGVGLADQAATIYSSEMAPPHLRGKLTMLFQLCVVTGIFIAQIINIGTSHLDPYGWRISLGLAAVPGTVLLIGGLLLPETPNSLIERGYLQRGRAVLEAIRGTPDVDAEYGTIVYAHRREKAAGDNQWKTMASYPLRPHLVMSIALPFFQQWTGINAVVFFSPFLFQGIGDSFKGETGSLVASAIVGGVQVLGTIVGIYFIDKVGRRRILIQASMQTFLAELVLGIVFAVSVNNSTVMLSGTPAVASIVLICIFVIAFGYGWGPLAWVISSEIQPLETRSLGQGITVFTQLMSGAIVGQTFLNMLCTMEYGVYIFFAVLQLAATFFVYYFLPETTGIPIEKVSEVFRVHPYWKKFSSNDSEGEAIQKELVEILQRQKQKRLSRLFKSARASAEPEEPVSAQTAPSAEESRMTNTTGTRQGMFDSSRSLAGQPEDEEEEEEAQNSLPSTSMSGREQPKQAVPPGSEAEQGKGQAGYGSSDGSERELQTSHEGRLSGTPDSRKQQPSESQPD